MARQTMWAAFLAAIFLSGPAASSTPYIRTLTCPIGGEEFEHLETMSYSTEGSRPDGKPYGNWDFPIAFPVCPSNGLVVFKEFTSDEIAKLGPIIASQTYLAMRKVDTPYYRAAWLKRQIEPGSDTIGLLIQAIWETDETPRLRARYLAELAESVSAEPPATISVEWFVEQARAINAMRELGRFDEALARLSALRMTALDATMLEGSGTPAEAMEEKRNALAYFDKLKVIIARKDASPEPLDWMPLTMAYHHCKGKRAQDPSGFCTSPEFLRFKEEIELYRKERRNAPKVKAKTSE